MVVILHKTCLRLDMVNSDVSHRCGGFLSDSGHAVCLCEVDWQKYNVLHVQVHD
jgi:hypothetical protein